MSVISTALQLNSLFPDWVIIGLGETSLLHTTARAVMITRITMITDIDKLKMWSTVKMEASGQSSCT